MYSSQALHKKGYGTTISVSSSTSTTVNSSKSLTSGVDIAFLKLSNSMGVSNSVSLTTNSSISYTISANTSSGKYRIEHIYPRYKVKQEIIRYSAGGGKTVTWSRTIDTAPRTRDASRRLNRYANP